MPEFPPKVEAALNSGELWKARDILRGRITSSAYSPDLYEQLGVVLLRMADVPEAGKYLFLSGRRQPEYDAAIGVFLHRHGRHGWRHLVASFPSSARRGRIEALPTRVLEALKERGLARSAGGTALFTSTLSSSGSIGGTDSLARALERSQSHNRKAGCLVSALLALLTFLAASIAVGWAIVHLF